LAGTCLKLLLLLAILHPSAPCLLSQPAPSIDGIIAALQARRYDDALKLCAHALQSDPRSPKVWTLRAVALEHTAGQREALAAYQEALKFAPAYLPALEGAAQIEYQAQSTEAFPLLERILAVQPSDATAHAMLGVLDYRNHDYAGAARQFAAAGDLLKSQPSALMDYALSLAHLDRTSEAIELLNQLVAQSPAESAPRYDLALLQWRSSASAEALATLQPLIDAQPPDAPAMRLAAAIHESNHETPQAVELLRAAILAHPDDPANYVDFAMLSFEHGSYSVGIDMVTAGLGRLPDSAPLYMARGVLYGENGDFEKAMADFERAHTIDPANSVAASAEGVAQSQRHNHPQALDDFRKQVREHPNDALGYYLLAEELSWSGSEEKSPNNQRDTAEAISNAAKAIRLDPHLVEAYDLLASLYLQNEQAQPAIDACHAALRINPRDQQALYTLILALRKTGSKEELKDLVQKLSSLRKEEQAQARQRYGRLIEAP
jgi:tetratricopeptide (TPR) repeat protein